VKYLISLDYDFHPLSKVKAEAARLEKEFDVKLEIWRSSRTSYHLHCREPMEWEKAKNVLDASSCSDKYKGLCNRMEWFPARHGEKLIFTEENNILKIIPATIRLF
jgi:hypothetical protein